MKLIISAFVLVMMCSALLSYGIPFSDEPPRIEALIEQSDAIVILRIDTVCPGFGSPDFYSTHNCFIYKTLKGNIPINTRVTIRLMDSPHAGATVYANGSSHLIFLIRKLDENEPTEYRSLMTNGAQVLLSPLGNEITPDGSTLEEQVRNVIKGAITYQTKEHEKRMNFLNDMLNQ